MPSLPYAITDRGEIAWDKPQRNSSAPVHSICGYGHTVTASYWSDSGAESMSVELRLNGASPDIVKIGQTFPDQDGSPYVIVDRREHGKDTFAAVTVTVVREDVHAKAMEDMERARRRIASRNAALRDPRLPRVKDLAKEAIGRAARGWYSDVYLDEDDGEVYTGGPTSMGFQTQMRQDNMTVLYRSMGENDHSALRDGRELHEIAVSAVEALHEREGEMREAVDCAA